MFSSDVKSAAVFCDHPLPVEIMDKHKQNRPAFFSMVLMEFQVISTQDLISYNG
jgi:hypothetical protein